MNAPIFYLVANDNAFILDDDGMTVYGAPVNCDGTVVWDDAYDFDPINEDDVEYIAHMSKIVLDMAALYTENTKEIFVK